MESGEVIFPMLLFIMSSFYIIGGAIDCGGNKISRTIFVNQQDAVAFQMIQAAIDSIKSQN